MEENGLTLYKLMILFLAKQNSIDILHSLHKKY